MVGGSARRVLIVSVLTLAWAPNAFADDSLLGSVTGATGEVGVGEVLEAVAPVVPVAAVAVEVPAVPVPVISAPDVQVPSAPAAIKAVTDGAGSVERALPPLPKPDAAVATVVETVTEVTRAVAATPVPTSSVATATRPRAGVAKRSSAAPARKVPIPRASAERAIARPESPQRVAAPATTSLLSPGGAVSTVVVRDAAVRPTLRSPDRVVHTPARQAAPERSAPLPVPSAPAPISTTGATASGAEGFWPVCAGLLLLVLLGRRLGPRVLQLVPEPHPNALLLRLERPG
jgi:hypothetical protein